ncbi:hypothetical protein HYFRA_00001630 [Hymenoscyphus fraxineus]|uniref:Cupin type-1 domain-containing protein n=1 Tax=Hymenoscyphus fraxineus TaxID=746836 RepID=A0A9N9L5Z2_9HELO|nr:hypothetical protein HYFRA_00001630 [Hymenoscyphus fraxineus]
MPPAVSPPERYLIKKSTSYVPNSPFPVLIYRSALPPNPNVKSTCDTIVPNNWLNGGVFSHYPAHHYHSVTHECYAVFRGHSQLLLGRGPLDPESADDTLVELEARDVIVIPAGVAHCNIKSSEDYGYVGLYPKGSPHYDNNFCKADTDETLEKTKNARAVPIPNSDPIYGLGGILVDIWKEAGSSR